MGRYITNINSYQDNELLLLKQGIAKNHKEFLTVGTDTWTIDHDVIVRVRVWGGGGGGGASHSSVPGAGGGAGGAAEAILRLGAGTYNITVGAGGAGAKSATSGAESGGSSSFHTYITCSGGFLGGTGYTNNQVFGGIGGAVSFDWSGFDGLLYADGQFGGRGGSLKRGFYSNGTAAFPFGYGPEGGAGESGGFAGYSLDSGMVPSFDRFMGGGGGGYNPPFIYGNKTAPYYVNSGRGVGTGGAGSRGGGGSPEGSAGNSGAVVIEWN